MLRGVALQEIPSLTARMQWKGPCPNLPRALKAWLSTTTTGPAWWPSVPEVYNSLQTLTCGGGFDQGLQGFQGVTLPNGLQTLALGLQFNQSLQGVTLPNGLQTLALGLQFNQSLQGVTLPNGLQSLALGLQFNQSLQGVTLPNGLQTLALGLQFQGVTLPDGFQILASGDDVNQRCDFARWS